MGGRRKLLLRGGDRWWVFRCNRGELDDALAATCRMALAPLSITPDAYEIRVSGNLLLLSLTRRRRAFELRFRGPWRATKKGALVRKLIAKQFEPVVPRIRIRLRQKR